MPKSEDSVYNTVRDKLFLFPETVIEKKKVCVCGGGGGGAGILR